MSEMLIFDWNGRTKAGKNQVIECTTQVSEFICGPGWEPVRGLGSMSGRTFASATLYIRVEIRSKCASHRRLKLIFNNWQYTPTDGEEYLPNRLQGPFDIRPGIKKTFSVSVAALQPHPVAGHINWALPVTRRGVVFKGPSGPATVKPAPFDFRYTVVAVSRGSKFSGWQNY